MEKKLGEALRYGKRLAFQSVLPVAQPLAAKADMALSPPGPEAVLLQPAFFLVVSEELLQLNCLHINQWLQHRISKPPGRQILTALLQIGLGGEVGQFSGVHLQ